MELKEIIIYAVAFIAIFGGSYLFYRKIKAPNTAYQREKREGKREPMLKWLIVAVVIVLFGIFFAWFS